MAAFIIGTTGKIWIAQFDFTGVVNAVALATSAEPQDATFFGDTTRRRLGGLKSAALAVEGYYDGTTFDDALFTRIGLSNVPVSIAPNGLTEGSPAYLMAAHLAEYTPGAAVGDMFGFSISAESSHGDGFSQGILGANRTGISANGNTAQFGLGLLPTGKKLHAALHVLAASAADTLDVRIESDVTGFASPITRLSFAQAAAVGSQWATPIPGPIATDDFWRVAWTVGGAAISFDFIVTLGFR